MIRALLLAALAAAPAVAKEKDDYAPLKPLIGKWDVARDCGVMKDKMYVEIVRLRNAVRATYYESSAKRTTYGKSEVFWNANIERFKIFTYIPQLTQMLGIQAIPGSLLVNGPDTEEPGVVTVNAHYSVIDGNMRLKLLEKNKQSKFTLRGKSPLGTMNCTGAGVKVGEFPTTPPAGTPTTSPAATPASGPAYRPPAKRPATADD